MEQLDIKSLYEEELKEKMISLGEKPFKGKQLKSVRRFAKKVDRTGATDTSGSCRSSDFKD